MLKRYGVNIPVGAVYSDDYSSCEEDVLRFERYRVHCKRLIERGMVYNRIISGGIDKEDKDYPRAVRVYRELLSRAEDRSVTVLCVGLMTAVAELLISSGDEISPLSGEELVKRKVKRVITMGIPENVPDFNWGMDAYAAEVFFDKCKAPIDISPEGQEIITGAHLSSRLEDDHPLRLAYETWLGKRDAGRSSWDLVATLSAIDENALELEYRPMGDCHYDASEMRLNVGTVTDGLIRLIATRCDAEMIARVLDRYMLGEY